MQQKKDIIGSLKISEKTLDVFRVQIKNIADIQGVLEKLEGKDASQIFEAVLSAALNLSASDIHIEPQEEQIVIRMRIDGILHDAAIVSKHLYELLLSRIKLLSELKLNIHNLPQEGRFSIRLEGRSIEMRGSILPSEYGEDIALRVLDPRFLLSLDELGMSTELQADMELELQIPQGLVLVTGPTGSGKTTTLYSFIQKLAKPGIKIITIEDPIEYHIESITQTQVDIKEGYTFQSGLRAILRQDPDVILVGELRERASAEAALQVSLAGKKVLATLHTNDAAGAVPRLGDLGIDTAAISAGLSAVIAQRLVRLLCTQCRKERPIAQKEQRAFIMLFADAKESAPQISTQTKIYEVGKGCNACDGGYKGRVGVFEGLFLDKELRKFIMGRPTEDEIRTLARKKGFFSMQHDAILKILAGLISTEEAERVLGKFK